MNYKLPILLLILLTTMNCKDKTEKQNKETENIFTQEWKGAYNGVPAFDKMDVTKIKPAIEQGMKEKLQEIDEITASTEEPTFENTIIPLEKSGSTLQRVLVYYRIFSSNVSSPEFRKVEAEVAPLLSGFRSKILQNKELFNRIKTVYNNSKQQPLPEQAQRTLHLIYEDFAMQGADLDEDKKKRYAEINKELSSLYIQFSNNLLVDEENHTTYLAENELGGLPKTLVNAMQQVAKGKGKEGKYAILNTRSYMDPFLTYSTNRELRKKVWTAYYSRGDNGDKHDNKNIIAEILKLRRERVSLLGYETFGDWRLQNRMAKNKENAMQLLKDIWPSAIKKVKEEVADMQTIANKSKDNITIEPWDYRFYAEKVRKAKYDLDSDEVKQYLQLEKLTDALFFVADKVFNYTFTPVKEGSVPVFHPDVKVWEVKEKETGKHVGLWYLDPFARAGKRSGAWATTYRGYTGYNNQTSILCSNNSNFVKPASGEVVLISWDDATTFLHEFGHALHFLSSKVEYPTLNGGVRDYTEFQSQLLERWLSTDELINKFFVHYKTGKVIPKELVAKIKKAETFNQGFMTTEYLASAIMDLELHKANPEGLDVEKFEKETLAKLNMPKELVMRHRTPQFGHVFSGEGYATAYYGYMWAEVLTSDAAEYFANSPNGFYNKELSEKLIKYLFSPRNAIDPAEAYRKFRGRDAKIDALMKDRGFSK